MTDLLLSVLLLLGGFFCLVAALGMLRLPDLLTRMHAATKAGTLGVGLLVLAAALYFAEIGMTLRALTVALFIFLTAPVAAHLIGRAAYHAGVPLSPKTKIDQLRTAQQGPTQAEVNHAKENTDRAG
ncbi:MAG: monovalent cation/H(+) antiporter subunit G [Desulfosarcinaceae bacterium]|nr:monovalent cation/H(+) antiporter subunit G [Desulfosarcinaceae bacterium]